MRSPCSIVLALALGSLGDASFDEPPLPADTLPAELPAVAPFGLPEVIPGPEGGAYSPEQVALGRKLFFDPILSLDRSVACASCHQPDKGFADDRPTSLGVLGRRTTRNSPTLFNRAFAPQQMWDGRAASLEEQALLPIENEVEMALSLDDALQRLRDDPEYAQRFEQAFDDGVTRANLAKTIAAFVRRLVFADSPVDRFRVGEVTWLTKEERAGMWLFESRAGCWKCHSGPNFSDEAFHNTGVGVVDGSAEPGREAITADAADRGRFKTATLRALAFTAPYMHDGSVATLEEVVAYYVRGGNSNPDLDPRLVPFEAGAEDQAALVAFLRALSRNGPPPDGPAEK